RSKRDWSSDVCSSDLELLSRLNFDEFLIHVRASFDMVIIDTPALSTGEDAAMISVRTGAALAVARNGQTRVASFNDMVQGLMNEIGRASCRERVAEWG